MPEDLKKLETLSYKPPGVNSKPTSTPSATLGFNSAVIKPETRVNKTESAEEHPEQPEVKNIKELAEDFCVCNGKPNQNLMIITEIEGLLSQVNDKCEDLEISIVHDPKHREKMRLQTQALEEIDLFQKTTLYELRKAFE